uniref:Uncharacterized protein n=1 Tax=uncultured prokaryote TaxID=198431 RepID=A0A0H5Q5E5_9ZZZZ|nr:hypothetical protein [uncultured prokaryote]
MDRSTLLGMPLYRAQVVLPYFTADAADIITNQFHFDGDEVTPPETQALDITDLLQTFYDAVYNADGAFRVNYVNWAAAVVKVYDLSDPTPRPLYENPMTFTAGSVAGRIPTEVSCVLTWRAAQQPGVRYQSLYNRVYLGAIPDGWLDTSTSSSFPKFRESTMDGISGAAIGLANSATAELRWVQVGKSAELGVTAVRDIVGGFVDDGPDTQRRRSVDAAVRTDWSA